MNQYEAWRHQLRPWIEEIHQQHKTYGYRSIALRIRTLQGVDGRERIHEQVVSLIDSEYIALCEGDDYWLRRHCTNCTSFPTKSSVYEFRPLFGKELLNFF